MRQLSHTPPPVLRRAFWWLTLVLACVFSLTITCRFVCWRREAMLLFEHPVQASRSKRQAWISHTCAHSIERRASCAAAQLCCGSGGSEALSNQASLHHHVHVAALSAYRGTSCSARSPAQAAFLGAIPPSLSGIINGLPL